MVSLQPPLVERAGRNAAVVVVVREELTEMKTAFGGSPLVSTVQACERAAPSRENV